MDHCRLHQIAGCRDSCGEIGMHLNETVPVEWHAITLFGGAALLRCSFFAMTGVAAVLLGAREHEELRAGNTATAQKCS